MLLEVSGNMYDTREGMAGEGCGGMGEVGMGVDGKDCTSGGVATSFSSLSSLLSTMDTSRESLKAIVQWWGRTERRWGKRGVTFSHDNATYCRVTPRIRLWISCVCCICCLGGCWDGVVVAVVAICGGDSEERFRV